MLAVENMAPRSHLLEHACCASVPLSAQHAALAVFSQYLSLPGGGFLPSLFERSGHARKVQLSYDCNAQLLKLCIEGAFELRRVREAVGQELVSFVTLLSQIIGLNVIVKHHLLIEQHV